MIRMPWTRAFAYVAAAVVLAIVYWATAPPPRRSPTASSERSATASPEPNLAIDTVRLEVSGRTISARREGEQWEIVEPAGATVPSDLIAALVSAVLETPALPVTSDANSLTEFGLDKPSARLTFGRPGDTAVTLSLGGTNPAATGIYGQLEGKSQVILLGLNVRYYIDLVLRQAKA